MKVALKVIVGVFAVIGFASVAIAIYVNVAVSPCSLFAQQAASPNDDYSAVFEQIICKDPAKNRSTVILSRRGAKERPVAVEVHGASQVVLRWPNPTSLEVAYPAGTAVKKYDLPDGWPEVILKASDGK